MMERRSRLFLALVLAQSAHSLEEYAGKLWEVFPPAKALTSLISENHELGFIVINSVLVGFAWWCFFLPMQNRCRSARPLIWFWALLELVNGIGHPWWSIRERAYTPGLVTAFFLFVISLVLIWDLRKEPGES